MRTPSNRRDQAPRGPGVVIDDHVGNLLPAVQAFGEAKEAAPGDGLHATCGAVGPRRTTQESPKPDDESVVSIEGIGNLSHSCVLESALR